MKLKLNGKDVDLGPNDSVTISYPFSAGDVVEIPGKIAYTIPVTGRYSLSSMTVDERFETKNTKVCKCGQLTEAARYEFCFRCWAKQDPRFTSESRSLMSTRLKYGLQILNKIASQLIEDRIAPNVVIIGSRWTEFGDQEYVCEGSKLIVEGFDCEVRMVSGYLLDVRGEY